MKTLVVIGLTVLMILFFSMLEEESFAKDCHAVDGVVIGYGDARQCIAPDGRIIPIRGR
jgi:hypothetical protein